MKWRSISSVTSKSAITPWRSGRVARIDAGVRPIIRFASAPDRVHAARLLEIATTGRLEEHDPTPADEHERVRGAEVDRHVAAAAE
jgi:hypothetical protein